MATAICVLFAVLVCFAVGFMLVEMCRGNLCAWLWYACGGLGSCLELLASLVAGIFEGLTGS